MTIPAPSATAPSPSACPNAALAHPGSNATQHARSFRPGGERSAIRCSHLTPCGSTKSAALVWSYTRSFCAAWSAGFSPASWRFQRSTNHTSYSFRSWCMRSLRPYWAPLCSSSPISAGTSFGSFGDAVKGESPPPRYPGWHIIGVASIGWVLTYAIWLAGWSTTKIWRIIDPPLSDYELRQRVGYELFNIQLPSLVGGFAAGFTVFLAYALLGFHRIKYANRVSPPGQPPADPAAAAPPAAH
jgi:hypothetical protein